MAGEFADLAKRPTRDVLLGDEGIEALQLERVVAVLEVAAELREHFEY